MKKSIKTIEPSPCLAAAGYYFDYVYPGMDYAISVSDVTSHVIGYTYNDANQLIRETENLNNREFEGYNEYTYDLNGNMIDKESDGDYDYYTYNYSYEFDAFNRLKKVNRVEHWDRYNDETWDYDTEVKNYEYVYEYNGNNELSSITSYLDGSYTGMEHYLWDRGYIVAKNGVSYYLGVDGVFAQSSGTNISYLLKNAHGDTVKVLCNGAVLGSEDYDPYGKDTDWRSYSSYKYANYYYDSNSGFYYLRNRFYDPSIGRFISEDPVHDGMNWYAYAGNNPIMFVDPLGLDPVPQWALNINSGKASENDYIAALRVYNSNSMNEWIGSARYSVNRAIQTARSNYSPSYVPSKKVENFIKDYEKCVLDSYDATPGEGDWTIGWGHKIGSGGSNPNITWTEQQADIQFAIDLNMMANATFNRFLKENNIILSQNQYDAMISWTFNYGQNIWDENLVGGYGEAMRNFLIKGDYSITATQEAFAVYSKSNTTRRNQEMNMFLYGNYTSTH